MIKNGRSKPEPGAEFVVLDESQRLQGPDTGNIRKTGLTSKS